MRRSLPDAKRQQIHKIDFVESVISVISVCHKKRRFARHILLRFLRAKKYSASVPYKSQGFTRAREEVRSKTSGADSLRDE